MKKAAVYLALLVLLAGSVPVFADGKFYSIETIPPEIPYQRALLLFDGDRETLLLQSKYSVAEPAVDDSFGWVVPVPSVPELASMDPRLGDELFRVLDFYSYPRVTQIGKLVKTLVVLALPLAALVTLLACLLSYVIPGMRLVRQHRRMLVPVSVVALSLGLCLVATRILLTSRMSLDEGGAGPGVEVIKAERVGVYDVQVVEAGQAGDLIEWLNRDGFRFDDTDTQVFDDYLQRGWCFVVARIDASSVADPGQVVSEGLVAPLIMRFAAGNPVYPLALTATSGHDTQILLYVLGQGKWQDDRRLALHYAGPTRYRTYSRLSSDEVQPPDFFSGAGVEPDYLCKFKGTLAPEQMREDLYFSSAADDEPYRKHIIIW